VLCPTFSSVGDTTLSQSKDCNYCKQYEQNSNVLGINLPFVAADLDIPSDLDSLVYETDTDCAVSLFSTGTFRLYILSNILAFSG